jgi:hypothetical protein
MDELEQLRTDLNARDIKIRQLEDVIGALFRVITEAQYAEVRGLIELGDLALPR